MVLYLGFSAAIYGLRNKKNVSVFILHPRGRVSPIQEAQMTTVLDPNVHNLAVEGTFDDCQDIVKTLFGNTEFNNRHHLGAVNSINWARILAQTTYYVYSYFNLLKCLNIDPASTEADNIKVHYSVPTGNFGDILAGYYARRMGLPSSKLIVATNSNDILNRFFETSAYEKQSGPDGSVKATLSPAMDILVSSNFERLLWYLARETEQDGGKTMIGDETKVDESLADHAGQCVAGWMKALKETGSFTINKEVVQKARVIFDSARVSDEDTLKTISSYHLPVEPEQVIYVLDPHTAVGVKAAEEVIARHNFSLYPKGKDIIVSLATAHPAKFSEAVETALKTSPLFDFNRDVLPKEFHGLLDKEKRIVVVDRPEPELVMAAIEKELKAEGIDF
jgi:threonine synthase